MTAVNALGALAQETRLAIFRLLVEYGPAGLAAGRIGEALSLPPATLSFHLKELGNAGLIAARQQSRFIYYSADFGAMNALVGYLTENCCRASTACDTACAPQCAPERTRRRMTARTTTTRVKRAKLKRRRVA